MRGERLVFYAFCGLLLLQIAYAAGGGGGGSSSQTTKFTFTNSDTERSGSLQNGRTYNLQMANRDAFELKVTDVEDYYIEVSFDGKVRKINKGETEYFDLNGNGDGDLSITFLRVSFSKASVLLTDLKDEKKLSSFEEVKEEVEEPAPYELQCNDLTTIRERVKCRLQLEANELREEAAYSIHEECRALQGINKDKCIVRYEKIATCYDLPQGPQRFVCGQQKLEIGNVAEEKNKCTALPEQQRETCLVILEEKVFNMIKFRLYDLEERAEDMLEDGADVEVVAGFVADIAESKIAFNNAQTIQQKKNIVLDVRQAWKNFLAAVKNE